MFVQLKCTSCGQAFDHDSSSGETFAECPHCNHANALPAAAEPPKPTVLHNAPNLVGTRPCPSCKAPLDREAILCVNCGFNLQTRKKTSGAKPNFGLLLAIGLILVLMVGGIIYLLQPADTPPPPVFTLEPAKVTTLAAPSQPAASAEAVTAPAEPTPAPAIEAPPAPPPKPTAEELAAQKAVEEEAAFRAKKAQAEQNLRLQLASREPPYQLNDAVELRRKNGVVVRGTFSGYGGTGPDRVILLATPTGEIGIPLNQLDPPSRRRVDPEYREAFIQHVLSTRTP
ncbi:MAG: zinc ribbon domain-containing protein [Kiritimatiellia bacterium]|jgi:type IV secretory pathway VirB10-like protein|nr:hypothetical protein [Kiritimatiellia bacterium]MBP9572796.1 hypothetical protein [Kiritimatiellia bacterium]OQC54952.1 MAG: hypothetical protein BWX54_02094 [Verrucomicrobia bacterium ADurb.Bin018]HOE00480.1 zinc ribbon domain-containing protein [Kiritimatiellia bacterium]HQM23248.1 zinc ribbon domain-containing protein [Kiritimatiellia bacterium]